MTSKADAKAALKDLRLRKRALAGERKIVRMELADVKRQLRGAGRGRSHVSRGTGQWGTAIRALNQLGNSMERSNQDRAMDAVQERVDGYTRLIEAIDGMILELERQMIAQST